MMSEWEQEVLATPGAVERVAEIEGELRGSSCWWLHLFGPMVIALLWLR